MYLESTAFFFWRSKPDHVKEAGNPRSTEAKQVHIGAKSHAHPHKESYKQSTVVPALSGVACPGPEKTSMEAAPNFDPKQSTPKTYAAVGKFFVIFIPYLALPSPYAVVSKAFLGVECAKEPVSGPSALEASRGSSSKDQASKAPGFGTGGLVKIRMLWGGSCCVSTGGLGFALPCSCEVKVFGCDFVPSVLFSTGTPANEMRRRLHRGRMFFNRRVELRRKGAGAKIMWRPIYHILPQYHFEVCLKYMIL